MRILCRFLFGLIIFCGRYFGLASSLSRALCVASFGTFDVRDPYNSVPFLASNITRCALLLLSSRFDSKVYRTGS
ncbi:hypothetical protein BU23DRAFT_43533 [Bimuria novae-zelandiae CBS 107.79]|uniref:Uncharacterized protein n=1 Tax=Bimuria novae-zelandiae CBS 107.79 TaxID=1447943 RepID=A0A6A5VFE6_9PLEO|nr:hypothetical protein BU23DRAFT_43533 [Bimuria novae-zelandiae CBS 107.79]